MDVVLDFETYRQEGELFDSLMEEKIASVKAPGNYKKKESIEKYLETEIPRVKQTFIEKAALSPLTGRLLVASLAVRRSDVLTDNDWEYHYLVAKTASDEPALIKKVDDLLSSVKQLRIITFSGRDFDIPFFTARAVVNGVTLHRLMPSSKYDKMHFDMRDVLPRGTLDDWSRAVLGEGKNGAGSMVNEWVESGNWDALEAYCQDIKLAVGLWERISGVVKLEVPRQ
jgi:DNA polymerase elongation subunit (family B)